MREERESAGLRAELAGWSGQASSVVGAIELIRAASRGGADATVERARRTVQNLTLFALDDDVRARAEALPPPELRALDAIHVATALSLETQLETLVSYDARMLHAAQAAGLPTSSPA